MLWIIISLLIGVVLCFNDLDFNDIKKYGLDLGEVALSVLSSLLFGVIGVLVALIVTLGVAAADPKVNYELVEEREIVALSDGNSMEAAHYIFSGYVEDGFVCRYVVNENGFKHIESVDAKHSYINEGEVEQPCVKRYKAKLKNRFVAFLCFEGLLDDRFEFYVPEGTVTTNYYNVDLQ